MNELIVWIALINFLAAFVQASTGFGYAIVAMFLMPRLIPFQQGSIISAVVIIIIALQMTISLRDYIRVKKVVWPMVCCLTTTWVGVYLIQILDEMVMRKIMGVFLILLAIYFYVIKKFNVVLKETRLNGLIIGLLTGLSTGMFNIVGPFLTLYYYDNFDSTLEFKANLELSFLIAGTLSLSMNLMYIQMDSFLIQASIFSGLAAILAGFLGLKLYYKIGKEKLKYIIIGILPVMGLIKLFK